MGTEIFVESLSDKKLSHKLVLLAKNIEGYRNIIELITASNLHNNSQIKVSFELLKKFSSSLVCLSGPISSEISYLILMGKTNAEIRERIQFYQNIF